MDKDTFRMPLYKPGVEVLYKGWPYKIDNVILSGYSIRLNLENCDENPVDAEKVVLEPTVFSLKRQP